MDLSSLAAFGHRVVYGGPRHTQAEPITPALLEELERGAILDPDHVPGELAVAELFLHRFPRTVHVACFDTAFHRDMPRVAQLFAIPRRYYEEEGIRRYGFHGLSYAFLLGELARLAGPEAAHGRLVLAHLGAGSSMAAVRNGTCVDTTMALTPVAGLVMATRSGDLDPGLLIHLLQRGLSVGQLNDLVNQRSGLLGVSGTTSDMKALLERERTDTSAAEAVELYCQQAAKYAAAMAVAAGGLDTLVFSAGIGERSPAIRARICARLALLGIRIDAATNSVGAPIISAADSSVTVRVIATNEELSIAQETLAMLDSHRTTTTNQKPARTAKTRPRWR